MSRKRRENAVKDVAALSARLDAVRGEIRAKQKEEAEIREQIWALLLPLRTTRRAATQGGSMAMAIVAMLDADPDMDFTARAIAWRIEALGFESQYSSVAGSVSHLACEGRIAKSGRGCYHSIKRDDDDLRPGRG